MTFADVKRTSETTIVFFPAVLGGNLNNALRKENITGWEILKPHAAETKYNIAGPHDEHGDFCVKIYADDPLTTSQVRALVSNFDKDEILAKIYQLHEDPDAMAYRDQQTGLLRKALIEDGFV